MMKKALVLILAMIMCLSCVSDTHAYSLLYHEEPIIHESQALQYLEDRKASDKLIDSLDFIYDYSEEVGIDPSIVVAMTSIETGFGGSSLFKNHNNPGGIKSSKTSNGWAHFETLEDGYRYMINLLATYAGLRNPNSRLFGTSLTTQGLAGSYWTYYGTDRGYHTLLTSVIRTMQSYPVKKDTKIKKKEKTESAEDIIYNIINDNKKYNAVDFIYSILNREDNDSGYDSIMKYLN